MRTVTSTLIVLASLFTGTLAIAQSNTNANTAASTGTGATDTDTRLVAESTLPPNYPVIASQATMLEANSSWLVVRSKVPISVTEIYVSEPGKDIWRATGVSVAPNQSGTLPPLNGTEPQPSLRDIKLVLHGLGLNGTVVVRSVSTGKGQVLTLYAALPS